MVQRPLGPLISSPVGTLPVFQGRSRALDGGSGDAAQRLGLRRLLGVGSPRQWGAVGWEPLMGVQQFTGGMGRTCVC